MYSGRYREAADLLRSALRIDRTLERPATETRNLNYLAAVQLATGDLAEARTALDAARRIADSVHVGSFIHAQLAVLQARAGDSDAARLTHAVVQDRIPQGNANAESYVYIVAGEIALAEGRSDSALVAFERSLTLLTLHIGRRGLARALIDLGRVDEALEELMRIVADRLIGSEGQEEWIRAHYDLGRLYQAQGDTALALDAYGRFLEIWNEADPDIPLVVDTRRQLVALTAEVGNRS